MAKGSGKKIIFGVLNWSRFGLCQTVTSTDYDFIRGLLAVISRIPRIRTAECTLNMAILYIKGDFNLYNFIHVNCIYFLLSSHSETHTFLPSGAWTAATKLIGFVFLLVRNMTNSTGASNKIHLIALLSIRHWNMPNCLIAHFFFCC